MKIIFGTTNNRKVADLQNISDKFNFDLEILSLSDINWNLGEIEETGNSLEENSLIKANAVKSFCMKNNINKVVVADDAGLMVDALNRKTRSTLSKVCRRPCTTRERVREVIR